MLLLVAFAQFLGVTLWLSATAAAPALAAELALMQWAWLTMTVKAASCRNAQHDANLAGVVIAGVLFAGGSSRARPPHAAIPLA